ncbi:hypothetical protein ABIB39_004499 [Mucilaginibacter sp. UYP27]
MQVTYLQVTEVTIIKKMAHTLKSMESLILKRERVRLSELAKERIIIGIRFICLFLFLYTAYAKIVDHARFYKGLTRVHLISAFAGFISYAVPVIEIIVSILLLIPQTAKAGLYAFTGIMSAFTLYIISAMLWEQNLPCHCGAAIEKLSWGQHIWFNLAFIFIAIIALRLVHSKYIFKKQ